MADAGSTFVVKFECGDDRRRVRLSELSYEVLQQAASEAYADMPEVQAFDLKYRDEDGDFCTLTPSTFVDFLDVTGSLATKLLRLTPRCPAPSVTTTPRVAAPPPCASLDATAALQGREGPLDACACEEAAAATDGLGRLLLDAAEGAGAGAEVESSARPEASPLSSGAASPSSSSSSSSSSESSCASSCTRRLEDAKQACLAAKQAWKEARQHYKNEVKAVRQSMKQAKKEWKREQKEKAKAMKRKGQRFSMPDQELQYTNNSHYDELVPLVAAPWPAGAEDEVEEASDDGFTWPRTFKPMKAPLDPADAPDAQGRPAAGDRQRPPPADAAAEAAAEEDPRPPPGAEEEEEERRQPEPERPAAKDDKDDKEKSNLEILKEMGFEDLELNAQLLKSNNDDVAAVLNILFGG